MRALLAVMLHNFDFRLANPNTPIKARALFPAACERDNTMRCTGSVAADADA